LGLGCGLSFCHLLSSFCFPWLLINHNLDAVFCGATVHEGAVVGNFETDSVENILKNQAKTACFLMEKRIELLNNSSTLPPQMNTCDFCNFYLESMIKTCR
jgi:hypothetical protein